jgi:hypothetical protein
MMLYMAPSVEFVIRTEAKYQASRKRAEEQVDLLQEPERQFAAEKLAQEQISDLRAAVNLGRPEKGPPSAREIDGEHGRQRGRYNPAPLG